MPVVVGGVEDLYDVPLFLIWLLLEAAFDLTCRSLPRPACPEGFGIRTQRQPVELRVRSVLVAIALPDGQHDAGQGVEESRVAHLIPRPVVEALDDPFCCDLPRVT